MSQQKTEASQSAPTHVSMPALSLAALGVVFGDIGTSPLYTLKTVLDVTGHSEPAAILGALSLILWTLIIVTSLKYVTIALRADNGGEGGILALMALLRRKQGLRQPFIILADRNPPSTVANPMAIRITAGSGQFHISRMAIDKRTVVASIVADTAIP